MTWTKMSDDELDDPDLLTLGRSVRLLYVEAKIWSNRHGTDGAIPRHSLSRITDEPDPLTAAGLLVQVGKWTETDAGWDIVGFLDDQPSAADVERTQALSRDRQRRRRQHLNGDHSLCEPKYCHASRVTSRVTNGVGHGTPSRPDPTRPEGTRGGEWAGGIGAPSESRRAPAPKGKVTNFDPRVLRGTG